MGIYRRKPTTVDAEQFTDPRNPPRGVTVKWWSASMNEWRAFVVTMQGVEVSVKVGEWIVAEPDGEHFYPIAAEQFAKVYEPADASAVTSANQ
jgi:hypothetical protein